MVNETNDTSATMSKWLITMIRIVDGLTAYENEHELVARTDEC